MVYLRLNVADTGAVHAGVLSDWYSSTSRCSQHRKLIVTRVVVTYSMYSKLSTIIQVQLSVEILSVLK